MSESPPFVVVKFLSINDDEDEYYEVALSKWVQDLDENMIGNILWPRDNSVAGTLVRTQANAQSDWPTYTMEVKRYYDTYFHARKGLTGIMEYASAYETETGKEMGRGKRKKRVKQITSSESDNDQYITNQFKKKKSSIPSPPEIHVPEAFISVDKNSRHKSKRYIIKDSSNIKEPTVARHLDKPIASENNREKLLEKIIGERKKAVKKAEEKTKATLLTAPSKPLQSFLKKQSELSTSPSGRYMKSPSIISRRNVKSPSIIVKSSKKTLSSNLKELYNDAKTKAKENIKKSENSPAFVDSLKTSSCTAENQLTPLLSEKGTSIVSSSKMSNISRKSDDSYSSSQKSSLLNLGSQDVESNQINPLSQSPIKDHTSLSTQEDCSPLSSKGKLNPPIRNLVNSFNGSDFHECFIRLEKKLENINSKIDVVIMNQANLNRSLLPEQAVISRPSNLPSLPLDDIRSLEEFEKFLSKDVNLSAACYYLKSLALGNNEKTVTSKLMSHLLNNSLATHFNFDGHNSQKATKIKRPFKELKLWELFQGVMLLKFPTSDLSEALNTVRNWLRNAAGRKKD